MEPDPISVRTDTHIEDVALDFENMTLWRCQLSMASAAW
jgi:hypothetical protein